MYAGFPIELISLMRCPDDAAELEAVSPRAVTHLMSATLRCSACRRQFPVEGGIVRLLDPALLDAESRHERTLRTSKALYTIRQSRNQIGSRWKSNQRLRRLSP